MSGLPSSADIVVIGAGISGAACAAAAATRGASVLLIDKEDGPAREGSGRAQGALRLQGREPVEFPLAAEAMRLWRQAGEEAHAHPELDFELVLGGNIYLCNDERELPLLRRLVSQAHAAGLTDVSLLDPEQAREIIPAAQGPFAGAMWSPVDGHCQPEKATRYFIAKAKHAGVRFAYNVKALKILERGGQISGVQTDVGSVEATAVVVAAGVWTPYLAHTVGLNVPVMPVTLSEMETKPLKPLFPQTVRAFGFGGRQRPTGEVVLSGGLNARVTHKISFYDLQNLRIWGPRLRAFRKDVELRADFARSFHQLRRRSLLGMELVPNHSPEPTPHRESVAAALVAMHVVIPAMKDATAARYWGGLVDMSPDGLPIIDGSAGPQGLSLVTGLSGHGLTLGPVLGQITADLAIDGRTNWPIEAFRLARFGEGTIPTPTKMI